MQHRPAGRSDRVHAAGRAARGAVVLVIAASAVYAPGLLLAQTSGQQSAPAGEQNAAAAAALASAVPGGYRGPTWVSFRSPKFEIPFSVDAVGTQPVEVQLLVSRDGGTRWEMFARQPAGSRQFPFQATVDGDYWFATRTIDATGAAHPSGPVAPQLRVTVDRTNPQIEAHADADGNGQIVVDFRITDAALGVDAIRLEYMTDAVRQWMPVENASQPVLRQQQGLMEGRIVWTPQSQWRHVSLCLIARDRAGNQTVLTRQVEKPRVASHVPAQLASAPLDSPAVAAGIWPTATDRALTMPPDVSPTTETALAAQIGGVAAPPLSVAPQSATTVPEGAGRRGYAPTAWGYAPAADGYAPAADGYAPAADGYAPAADGYAPAADSYAPAAGGYAPAAGGPRLAGAPVAGEMRGFGTHLSAGEPRWPIIASGPSLSGGDRLSVEHSTAQAPPAIAATELGLDFPSAESAAVDDSRPQAVPRSAAAAMRPLPIEELPAPLPSPVAAEAAVERSEAADQETLTVQPLPDAPAVPRPTDGSASSDPPRLSRTDLAQLAGMRQTNSHKFSLDYEVEAVGSGGLGAVELWATKDQGQTWEPWGQDPDGESPFDIETVGQGVYGFKMVVIGGNGLTSPRPMSGDPADLYVMVDTQQPAAKITGAQYGQQEETGQLIISYRCEDPNGNLVDRPVTLSFAAAPDGPWTTIATGLENGGRYAWPADPQLPRQIYLRVEAVDQAGNVGGYTLDTPVNVQGLAPRARIRGFNPVAENNPSSAPTARLK